MKLKSLLIGIGIALAIYLIISEKSFLNSTKGNGKVTTEIRSIADFDAIECGGAFQLFLNQGEGGSLKIETDENIIPIVVTEVKNGKLIISTKENIKRFDKLNIYITKNELREIDLSGAAKLKADDEYETKQLEIEMSGASELEMKLSVQKLDLDLSGAANANLYGMAKTTSIEISGAAELHALDMPISEADIDCSGAANAYLNIMESIQGEASGASNIRLKGNPQHVNIKTSGAASIDRD
jgi:hypothetical protein